MEETKDLVVRLGVPAAEAELAADALWGAGATAVGEVGDDPVTLTASFPTPAAARVVAAEIAGAEVVEVDPAWRDAWRAHAAVVVVGATIGWTRWGRAQTWIVFFPTGLLVMYYVCEQTTRLLPNLL